MDPIRLGPNQPAARPYRGGPGIRAFRGTGSTDPFSPEDFVASTTTVHGSDTVGLSALGTSAGDAGGRRSLRDAVAADPVGYLGAEHVARFGPSTELLVKILDARERLFNHVHPDDAFAARHLGAPHGKTEAWLIVSTGDAPTAPVWLGFRRDIGAQELARWFDSQASSAMLDALNRVEVGAGDTVLVPAGTPHAIGAGITLVELQQPSDLSIILEHEPFPGLAGADPLLGLDREVALSAVTREALDPSPLVLRAGDLVGDGRTPLLPAQADAFFRRPGRVDLDAAYAVLVVIDGVGELGWADGSIPLSRGAVLLVPHGAGPTTVTGDAVLVRCRPPSPARR